MDAFEQRYGPTFRALIFYLDLGWNGVPWGQIMKKNRFECLADRRGLGDYS